MRTRSSKGKYKTNCSKCNCELEENRIGKQRYCQLCKNESMRKNRPKHSEMTEQQKLKNNARSYLHVYVKRGKIKKENCKVCNNRKTEAHHEDYARPIDVIWLCKKHHIEIHRRNDTEKENKHNN